MKKYTGPKFIVVLIIIFVLISITSCTGNNGGEVEIKSAPIHELDIRFAESYPIQVFLYIKGGLSDGCTKFHGIEIKSRSGNNIKIEVTVERPRDAVCPAVYTFFEQNFNLGTDFVSGERYTVTVNDASTSFVMQ
jgi:outer membrane receptor for Fe3+-dicitrate